MVIIDLLEALGQAVASGASLRGCGFAFLAASFVLLAIWYWIPGELTGDDLLFSAILAGVGLLVLVAHVLVKPVRRHR